MNNLLILARNVIDAADDVISAIDGTTDQFEPECAALASATSRLEDALPLETNPTLEAGLHPYSVLLAYPPHTTDGDLETYFDHVWAPASHEAVEAAREMASKVNAASYSASDFRLLACFSGHIELELDCRDERNG